MRGRRLLLGHCLFLGLVLLLVEVVVVHVVPPVDLPSLHRLLVEEKEASKREEPHYQARQNQFG